jgi:hypothetical protein
MSQGQSSERMREVAVIGRARRFDRAAATKLAKIVSRKKETEAVLLALGLKTERSIKSLIR